MTIMFSQIPASLRYPGAYVEIDPSQAGLSSELPSIVLVGQKLATGTAVAGEITLMASAADAVAKAGAGSMLAQMASLYRNNDSSLDVYLLPLADLPAGVAATGTITATGTIVAAGVIPLYIAGRSIPVGVLAGDAPAAVAAKIAAAITAAGTDVPVTAGAAAAVVTLTARHKGTCGNGIDIRLSWLDEPQPAGFAATITAMTGGSGDPDLSHIQAMLGERHFWYVALGNANDAAMQALHTESQRRYAYPVMRGLRAFTAHRGDYAAAVAYGEAKNYEHIACLSLGLASTATPWEAAAALAAASAPALFNSPVTSQEGVPIKGIYAKKQDYHDFTQANSLLFKGMSVMEIGSDGACYIKRVVTLYQERSDGSADDTYLDIATPEVLDRIRYEQRIGAIQRFRGTIAAKSKEDYRPGLLITTADDIRAYLLELYKNDLLAERGWVQKYKEYKAELVVEQDPQNPNRFNYRDTPTITAPFYILAGRMAFKRK